MNYLLFIIFSIIILSIIMYLINYKKTILLNTVYDYKVSKEYANMFSQPSIWTGYQDYDPKHNVDKLYVKNI